MVIKNAKIVNFDNIFMADVLVEDGLITRIDTEIVGHEILDIEGKYLLPGLIDLHVRTLDDKINSDNFVRLSCNAKKGGVTTIALIADLQPPISDEITLEFVKSQDVQVTIYPLVMALRDENSLSELAILLKKGALSIFTPSDINEYLLARVFEYAKMRGVVLHIEPKNSVFRDVGVMNESEVSFRLGLGGISELEEISEIAKVLEFANFYKVPVLFKSVSTPRGLELIAKSRYAYAEVSIHHLLFSDEACEEYNTFAKLSPPLRNEEQRQQLIQALQEGKIDLLTSLHSPKSFVNKDVSFDDASFGIDALGYYLPLLYDRLVKQNIISFSKLVELTATNPGCFVDEKVGKIEEGYSADFIIFDPEATTKVTVPSLYTNKILQGSVVNVIKNGEVIYG
ncbi:amidohydrolase family protein [Nitratiruptor tergarcus]|uniref:Dihydroorotase n=1 Tax=Nitratiruptor tergarcus DSM 16512 TaxID=1069081 RepID=A0A1W1WT08_9BACT|nr:amidohydrolase family protein [Nitratiruptor tergarcus]SMC09427.1 dihydroorotase [Nitratiruptor tergarcus DSM 16512]